MREKKKRKITTMKRKRKRSKKKKKKKKKRGWTMHPSNRNSFVRMDNFWYLVSYQRKLNRILKRNQRITSKWRLRTCLWMQSFRWWQQQNLRRESNRCSKSRGWQRPQDRWKEREKKKKKRRMGECNLLRWKNSGIMWLTNKEMNSWEEEERKERVDCQYQKRKRKMLNQR